MKIYDLKDILKQLDRRLAGQINNGIESDIDAISSAIYDIIGYLIEKEEKDTKTI